MTKPMSIMSMAVTVTQSHMFAYFLSFLLWLNLVSTNSDLVLLSVFSKANDNTMRRCIM